MARRRMVIGYVEVLSPVGRLLGAAATGRVPSVEEIRRPPTLGRYWCAADRPETGYDFRIRPVHRTESFPADAACEDCGIELAHLARELTAVLEGAE